MRNLISIIIKYHFLILFLLIESFSIFLVIRYNSFHRTNYLEFSTHVSGKFYEKKNDITQYVSLKQVNLQLLEENNRLRNQLTNYKILLKDSIKYFDTLQIPQYRYIYSKVVNVSLNKQYNYVTINKGSKEGIKPEMAVISGGAVVGFIFEVSEHYSIVLPIINRFFKLSSRIKNNSYFGSLTWEGYNYKLANLSEIPYHVKIRKGERIVTSGFSSMFPEGILVGTIEDYDISEGNFYNIKVNLATDYRKLAYVYVIENLMNDEQKQLEKKVEND